MEPTKRIVILLILLLLTSVPAQSTEQSATRRPDLRRETQGQATQISNTRTASCVVKITSDPMVLPLNDATIDYLLHSTGIGGRVTREVLNISPDQVSEMFTIEALVGATGILPEPLGRRSSTPEGQDEYEMMMARETDASASSIVRPRSSRRSPTMSRITSAKSPSSAMEQTILFKLQVNLPEKVKPVAEEFMDALVGNLRSTLVKAFEDYRLRFEAQLQLTQAEAANAENDLRENQKILREISGSYVLDRTKILADISRLRQEVQTAKMSQASNQVIIDATTKRIAEIQAKIKERLENDPITKEYQGIVEMSDKLVEQAERAVQAGMMQATQLEDLKVQLARAKIELARRREELSKSAGGSLIESFNKELANRWIQATQDEANLSSQEKQLTEIESLLVKADDYELLSLKADIAKQNLQEAMLWRDRMSRQIRLLQPPMVSILGGE